MTNLADGDGFLNLMPKRLKRKQLKYIFLLFQRCVCIGVNSKLDLFQ